MFFVELMQAVRPHLASDRTVPDFVQDMLERLSSVPEEQWFDSRAKAPGADYAVNSLKKIYTRGLTKKLARRMLNNPTRATFVDSLNYVDDIETESAEEVKAALVEAVQPLTDVELDEDNIGDVLFDLFQRSFEYIVTPELENDRKIQQATTISNTAKGKFGTRLLEECKHTCSRNGCGQHLHTNSGNAGSAPLYEIARIEGDLRDYSNLVPLCPACFQSYVLSHTRTEANALKKVKDIQVRSAQAREVTASVDIERGIAKVIEKLGNANYNDLETLDFEPVAIKDKIDERSDFFIYDEVVTHVTRYYRFIERQMQEEVRLKTFDDTLLRAQIKALARRLTDKGYSKMRVHSDLTDRLTGITKQEQRYCAYVVSYFVQSCEVFDAAS